MVWQFFYDNPEIAEKYGLVTCIDGEPAGFVTWDPRNSNLAAPKNYESVGFTLYDRKPNETESTYTGDYLYYEIMSAWDRENIV